MDIGFWSSDAETWYQQHVARYLGGEFKCENQTEWKRSAKAVAGRSKNIGSTGKSL